MLQKVLTGNQHAILDAFALKNSGLNEFLFAEVGNEVNGSPLTILSVLARLGMDPWTEAARLTRMPKAAFIDCLTNCISQMPLCPQALLEARATAARLFTLLPSPVLSPRMRQIIPSGRRPSGLASPLSSSPPRCCSEPRFGCCPRQRPAKQSRLCGTK